jgi:glycosyltransferase involved in cell wall biosynthesis
MADFEFILVDDGSSDGTLTELRRLEQRDPRVRMFAPGRLGAAAAYNYGVAQARGERVARQDFDDRSYPERLRLQVALLDAQPEVRMVGRYYLLVDERRGERYVRMPPAAFRSWAFCSLIPLTWEDQKHVWFLTAALIGMSTPLVVRHKVALERTAQDTTLWAPLVAVHSLPQRTLGTRR